MLVEVEDLIVHFKFNKFNQSPEDLKIVKDWAARHKNIVAPADITVSGHTDIIDTHNYNKWLSERRAAAVVKILQEQGISVDKSNISGKSFDHPVAEKKSNLGRAKNRRTEVLVRGDKYKVKGIVETGVIPQTPKELAAKRKKAKPMPETEGEAKK